MIKIAIKMFLIHSHVFLFTFSLTRHTSSDQWKHTFAHEHVYNNLDSTHSSVSLHNTKKITNCKGNSNA